MAPVLIYATFRGRGGEEGGVLPMMAYLFREKRYIKGKGLVLGEEPPRMNICRVPPGFRVALDCEV